MFGIVPLIVVVAFIGVPTLFTKQVGALLTPRSRMGQYIVNRCRWGVEHKTIHNPLNWQQAQELAASFNALERQRREAAQKANKS